MGCVPIYLNKTNETSPYLILGFSNPILLKAKKSFRLYFNKLIENTIYLSTKTSIVLELLKLCFYSCFGPFFFQIQDSSFASHKTIPLSISA